MMETMFRMADEPEAGCRLKRSMPEISRRYRSRLCITSRTPWTVAGSCRGCRSARRGLAARASLILGLSFVAAQVPWPMSTFRSAPRFSWDRRRKCLSTRIWPTSGSRGGVLRTRAGGSAPRPSPTSAAMPGSAGATTSPRSPGLCSSKISSSSHLAWWNP